MLKNKLATIAVLTWVLPMGLGAAAPASRPVNSAQVASWRTHGNPNDPSAWSLDRLQRDFSRIHDDISKALIDDDHLSNTDHKQAQAMALHLMADPQSRKISWENRKRIYQGYMTAIDSALDPDNDTQVQDEFGDVLPRSLPQRLGVEKKRRSLYAQTSRVLASHIDGYAAEIPQADPPILASMPLQDLRTILPGYFSLLFKPGRMPTDPDQILQATSRISLITHLHNPLEQTLDRWSRCYSAVRSIRDAMDPVLPQARAAFSRLVTMCDDLLADADQDIQDQAAGTPISTVIARKSDLIQKKMFPRLTQAQDMFTKVLIPYQKRRIQEALQAAF